MAQMTPSKPKSTRYLSVSFRVGSVHCELEGPIRPLKAKGLAGIKHVADTMLSLINIQSLNGKITITAPMRFNHKPFGDLAMKDWRHYVKDHPELTDIKLPAPVDVPAGEPQVGMVVGNDFPIINQMLDLDSPGPVQIGTGGHM